MITGEGMALLLGKGVITLLGPFTDIIEEIDKYYYEGETFLTFNAVGKLAQIILNFAF